ncbi:unnamed protein product [Sphagnum troendelagicum]|uniref:Cationic amino acid transporter C-terminal domain-containing protein n=1 Tax=Sphagnum troendelagicum TaxID=128251 RepID=A0ABP0U3F6_9BRYO
MEILHVSSFSSLESYGCALLQTPRRFSQRACAVSTVIDQMTEVKARSGAEMDRRLQWWDMIALGVGGMMGAGIFISTGIAARDYAGPAVVVSYLVAGISALLSAFCYTEFAVEMPVAGGAFSYLQITFGEFAAYITGANLIMEYLLSNAAVARSLTSYVASAFGVLGTNAWRVEMKHFPAGYNQLDFLAVTVVVTLTICLCFSTKNSSTFNLVMTVLHIAFVLFIIVAGFAKGDVRNLTIAAASAGGAAATDSANGGGGFAPFGMRGIFNGAAIVYFSYIGYDAVSTTAEEVKNPAKNMTIGLSGSVIAVTILYCFIALALCMLQPYNLIDSEAPFSTAFQQFQGWEWASNFIGAGASLGIFTSLLVAMLGQARYMCVLGRAHVVPACFATVNASTNTPINATLFLGICTAFIAFFTDLHVLLDLISIGTLFVFYMVANALVYRRHVVVGKTSPVPTLAYLTVFTALAACFVSLWQTTITTHEQETQQHADLTKTSTKSSSWGLLIMCAGLAIFITAVFWWKVPAASPCVLHNNNKNKERWTVPSMPWIAAASIFLNIFLLGSVDKKSYVRFAIWTALAVVLYFLYVVHSTNDAAAAHETVSQGSINLQAVAAAVVTKPGCGSHEEDVQGFNLEAVAAAAAVTKPGHCEGSCNLMSAAALQVVEIRVENGMDTNLQLVVAPVQELLVQLPKTKLGGLML